MHEYEAAGNAAEEYRDPPAEAPSFYRIVRTLGTYRYVIGLSLLAVMVAYVIVAAILLLRAPSQRVVVLPFRLEFAGAGDGRYPNGLKFSSGDIVSGPVTTAAYQRNGLQRFISLPTFMSSLVVLESNAALEKLTSEYRSRLADPRLTPVDRERLVAEFEQKSASLNKDEWSLSLVLPDRHGSVPPTVANKVLHDVLHLWADDTARTRRALQYQVPTLTANIFTDDLRQDELVISLTILRARISDVIANIDQISKLPGAPLMRSRSTNRSLAEIELLLSDLLRAEVEPLIAQTFESGAIRYPSATLGMLEAQRDYDQRRLAAATRKAEILRSALTDYVAQQPAPARTDTAQGGEPMLQPRGSGQGGETVVPQLNDSFLERLVNLASNSADREYRQGLVGQIRDASLETLPLQATVAFDEQVIEYARSARPVGGEAAEAMLRARYEGARRRAITAVNEINEIYSLLSRNLQPAAQLYSVTGAVSSRIERTLSMFRLVLGGLITFLVALPIICLAAFIHHRFLREEAEEEHGRDTVERAAQ